MKVYFTKSAPHPLSLGGATYPRYLLDFRPIPPRERVPTQNPEVADLAKRWARKMSRRGRRSPVIAVCHRLDGNGVCGRGTGMEV